MSTLQTARRRARRTAAPLLLAATWLGCARDETGMTEPSSQPPAALREITGRILGPDGRNICRTIEEGTMLVYLIDNALSDFFGIQEVTCPENSFSLSQDPADVFLRTEMPINDNIDALPWRTLDQFTVPAGGGNHPVHIEEARRLGGRATFDGEPLEGVPLAVLYDFNPGFAATFGGSGPDGRWVEFFGRPMLLQTDVSYFAADCFMIGTTLAQGFLFQGFLFPSSRSAINCRFETAPVSRFTHSASRLKVTPMPGDIGGTFDGAFFDQYGVGFGAQFPFTAGQLPPPRVQPFTEIFNGGLIIGLPAQNGHPARTLLGTDGAGEFECGFPCRDLGFDSEVSFTPTGSSGVRKQVTWRYSDAGSENAAGLEVIQQSVDAQPPHDYVLFRFRIRNTGPSDVRFFAGFFGDLDVGFDNLDDRGATARNGRLMYQASDVEGGDLVGTMLLGDAPVTGNYFFTFDEDPLPVLDQIRALRGNIRRATAGAADQRSIHGSGPYTLGRGEAADLWLAMVAGETRSQLLANADAAGAHVNRMRNTAISTAGETVTMRTVLSRTTQASRRPTCKSCTAK
ncbi:MAG TPA: hypothetical protein VIQ27_05320 [Gemmatimonadales bacterium]